MNSGHFDIEPGFLDHSARRLFHVTHKPRSGEIRGSVLFLHAFAEEMHMSRRNVAAQARLMAAAGYHVMLLDLTGCGDAGGDFADATWHVWLEDALFAMQALRDQASAPLLLWGMRLGGLLACELAVRDAGVEGLLLWQPVLNGEQQIDQFLRLKTAASAMAGAAGFDRKKLWNELRNGRSLEVAGYELSPAMAQQVSRCRLHDLRPDCPVNWFEVRPSGQDLAVPARNVIRHWREQGLEVTAGVVHGEAFWRNHDAPLNPQLQQRTLEVLV
jgi:exosortase A-associated hydrolase 2